MKNKDTRTHIKLGMLVEDLDVYPRASVDSTHVGHIADAIEAGATLPPVIADSRSKRIVDGFHRCRAYRRMFGDDYDMPVVLREYETEADLFADAVRLNSAHGNNITTSDRVRCILIAERIGLADGDLCEALNITVDRLEGLRVGRIGRRRAAAVDPDGGQVALKYPVRHMAGQRLTAAQVNAMPRLGGNQQVFYVNQLIRLIDSKLLDTGNEKLMERLEVLRGKLGNIA